MLPMLFVLQPNKTLQLKLSRLSLKIQQQNLLLQNNQHRLSKLLLQNLKLLRQLNMMTIFLRLQGNNLQILIIPLLWLMRLEKRVSLNTLTIMLSLNMKEKAILMRVILRLNEQLNVLQCDVVNKQQIQKKVF